MNMDKFMLGALNGLMVTVLVIMSPVIIALTPLYLVGLVCQRLTGFTPFKEF